MTLFWTSLLVVVTLFSRGLFFISAPCSLGSLLLGLPSRKETSPNFG